MGIQQDIMRRIDVKRIADLTLELAKISSVTGNEEEASEFYADTLREIGLHAKLEYVAPKSPNVLATIHGVGDGPSLLLNDHIDTVPPGKCPQPSKKNGILHGRGTLDAKCGLAAMAEVARALVDSGVTLAGDLVVTAVAYHEVGPRWPYDESLDRRGSQTAGQSNKIWKAQSRCSACYGRLRRQDSHRYERHLFLRV